MGLITVGRYLGLYSLPPSLPPSLLPPPSLSLSLSLQICSEKVLQATDFFIQKLIQTYEMMIVRHGFMLVGGPFASKTKVLDILARTLTLLNGSGQMDEFKTMYKVTIDYHFYVNSLTTIIAHMRRRVTVVGSVCVCVCVCVCVSVCLLSHISPLERLFVLKILSRTLWPMEVKQFVGFSLKPLHCGDPAVPPLKAICTVGHFPAESVHVYYSIGINHAVVPRVLHFSAFIGIAIDTYTLPTTVLVLCVVYL